MKTSVCWLLGICVFCATMLAQTGEKTRFSVSKSIEMNTFSDPYTRDASALSQMSPDGKYFVVVTTKGSLVTNQLESKLFVYSADEIRIYLESKDAVIPKPRPLFAQSRVPEALQQSAYGSLITGVQWEGDSRAVLAMVEMSKGRHLFRICVTCHEVASDLTPGRDVDVQRFSESAGTIAYVLDPKPPYMAGGAVGEKINDRASALTGLTIFNFLQPEESVDRDNIGPSFELWITRKGKRWKAMGDPGRYFPTGAWGLRLALSPDGDSLIAADAVKEVPESWSSYRSSLSLFTPGSDSFRKLDRSGRSPNWPWEYTLIDIKNKTSQPLVSVPSTFLSGRSDRFGAVWSRDEKRIIFTGTYLPLEQASHVSHIDPHAPCAAAVYEVAEQRATCIVANRFPQEYLMHAEFGESDKEIKISWLKDGQVYSELFDELGEGWYKQADDEDIQPEQTLTLSLRQDMNVPAKLWANDSASQVSKLLLDPNPQLKGVQFGEARVYRWKDDSGYHWRGGLVLPPNYVPGQRYPFVIQTHGFANDKEFLADGAFTTGFAAQALAAAGIVVLQMEDRKDRFTFPPTEEATVEANGFISAIHHLDADGLIDPSRVGIIGFSRTQWYVERALIDCPHCFRAATVIDGLDQSYLSDVLFTPYMAANAMEHEAANGGKPFGPGLQKWMQHAVGFNLDKVETPVRIEAIGKMTVVGEWELYSILTQQEKPVDLIYIPDGQHILQAPLDRYASQQGNVDWFRFWLQDYERPDAEDAQQYERWEHLRDLQNKTMHLPLMVPASAAP